MAKNSANITSSATITDSQFQAMCSLISGTFDAGGMTKTGDAGQMNPATVTFPGGNNTAAGYEIRNFAGYKVKFEYGRGASADGFQIWVTVGTGSDGSGNITGELIARGGIVKIGTTGGTASLYDQTATLAWNVTADENYFGIFTGETLNSGWTVWEKTTNADKSYSNKGICIVSKGITQALHSGVYDFQAVNTLFESDGGCFMPGNKASGTNGGGNILAFPYYMWGQGELLPPLTVIAGGLANNFDYNEIYPDVTLSGESQAMKCLQLTTQVITNASGSNSRVLIRWED